MKRFMKYYRTKKGITLVLIALMLAVLLFFLGMAVDISYMYHVKNQLQVAADAAALAGVALISDPDDLVQANARAEAIIFAAKNSAAGIPVEVITDNNNTLSNNNDITVGNWDANREPKYLAGQKPVNAIEVRPQRVQGLSGSRGDVRVFVGQVFRLMGIDWSRMSAAASAIASGNPLQVGPFPICVRQCGSVTPLTITGQNLTPGTRFILKNQKGTPNIGWTTFLDNNTSKNNIEDYLRGIKTPPDVCHECIFTTQGVVGPSPCVVREMIKQKGANHDVNGVTIFGWKILLPILPDTPCPAAKGTGCFEDPGYQPGDPYEVTQYALAIITDAVPQGNCPHDPGPLAAGESGIVMVGLGPGASGTSTINCLDCSDPVWNTLIEPPKLVK